MIIDFEAVLADLEAYVLQKPGHSFGERELTDLIRRLRVQHRVQEGLAEKAFRLYSGEILEVLRPKPHTEGPAGPEDMADDELARIGA